MKRRGGVVLTRVLHREVPVAPVVDILLEVCRDVDQAQLTPSKDIRSPSEHADGGTPTGNDGSEGGVGKVSTRRAFLGYLRIGARPSAFAVGMLRDIYKKDALGHRRRLVDHLALAQQREILAPNGHISVIYTNISATTPFRGVRYDRVQQGWLLFWIVWVVN